MRLHHCDQVYLTLRLPHATASFPVDGQLFSGIVLLYAYYEYSTPLRLSSSVLVSPKIRVPDM